MRQDHVSLSDYSNGNSNHGDIFSINQQSIYNVAALTRCLRSTMVEVTKNIFSCINFMVIEVGLSKDDANLLKDQVQHYGGNVVDRPYAADVILTVLKSPARIARHVDKDACKPIVHKHWIDEWY
jgi:hypothetical protein